MKMPLKKASWFEKMLHGGTLVALIGALYPFFQTIWTEKPWWLEDAPEDPVVETVPEDTTPDISALIESLVEPETLTLSNGAEILEVWVQIEASNDPDAAPQDVIMAVVEEDLGKTTATREVDLQAYIDDHGLEGDAQELLMSWSIGSEQFAAAAPASGEWQIPQSMDNTGTEATSAESPADHGLPLQTLIMGLVAALTTSIGALITRRRWRREREETNTNTPC